MRRWMNLILVGLMIAGAVVTFETKRKAEIASAELAKIKRNITMEKENIDILRAEWNYLTEPARLQTLAERYTDFLNLQPLDVEQIISAEELPNRPLDLTPYQDNQPLGGYAGGSPNTIQ